MDSHQTHKEMNRGAVVMDARGPGRGAALSRALALLWAVAMLAGPIPGAWACEDPPVQVMLTVIAPVHGSIDIHAEPPGGDPVDYPDYQGGTLTFDVNTQVAITATADLEPPDTYTFLNWAPPFVGELNPLVLTLEENETVEAYFYDDHTFPDANLEAAVRYAVGNSSDPLTPAQLEGLSTLVAVGYGIADLTGLEQCTGLEILWLPNNQITDLSPLSGLTALTLLGLNNNQIVDLAPLAGLTTLTSLELDDNLISDVDPLEGLYNLSYLSLRDNQIEYLGGNLFGDDWGLMANDGLGAGNTVDLRGNPLSAWALCWDIPELEARGVTVIASEYCDSDPESGADQDGDGLSNADEWSATLRYFNGADEQALMYHLAICLPDIPGLSLECLENLHTVTVTVAVEGEGSVYLGDSTTTTSWDFAKWATDCPDPCPAQGDPPPDCAYNQIALVAEPAEGWVFKGWQGQIGLSAADDPALILDMSESRRVVAQFVPEPEVSTQGLMADLARFLEVIGETETVETFDLNEIVYDENGERVYVGNGIPDAAEFYLLQRVLESVNLSHARRSGMTHGGVCAAWTLNVAQAEADLSGAEEAIINTVAAYMTLGDFKSATLIAQLVQTQLPPPYNVTLDPDAYHRSRQRRLYYKRDADNDGYWNVDEWEAAWTGDWAESLELFATQALDGVPPAGAEGEGEGEGEIVFDCETCDCARVTILSLLAPSPCKIRARLVPQDVELPLELEGFDEDVPLGQEIELTAEVDDGYGLLMWGADNTMADASRQMKQSFVVQGETVVYGLFIRWELTVHYDTIMLEFEGPECEYGAFVEAQEPGTVTVLGPPYSSVRLAAKPLPGYRATGWMSFDYALTRSRFCAHRAVGHVSAMATGAPPHPNRWTASVLCNASGGGLARIAADYGGSAQFLGSATYDNSDGELTAHAEPFPGYEFVQWCQCPGWPSHVADHPSKFPQTLTAEFREKDEYQLIVETRLLGDGVPPPEGGGGSPPTAPYGYVQVHHAQAQYPDGEIVMLVAQANPGYTLVGWDGHGEDYLGVEIVECVGNVLRVVMDAARHVVAQFATTSAEIVSADITRDSVEVALRPLTAPGKLTLELVNSQGGTHSILNQAEREGQNVIESFDIPAIPLGCYTSIRAVWDPDYGAQVEDTHDYTFRMLGLYLHTSYNTPDESLCEGEQTECYGRTVNQGTCGTFPSQDCSSPDDPPECDCEPTLTMSVQGSGTTSPAVGSHNYEVGTVVSLSASPGDGWQFDHWEGFVADPRASVTTIQMTQDRSVQATFVEEGGEGEGEGEGENPFWELARGKPQWLNAIYHLQAGAGGGISADGRFLTREWTCASASPCGNRSALRWVPDGPCAHCPGALVEGDVAIRLEDPPHPDLECGSRVFVYRPGEQFPDGLKGTLHSVRDTGENLALTQLDHYRGIGECFQNYENLHRYTIQLDCDCNEEY